MERIEYDPKIIYQQFVSHCVDILNGEDNWEDMFEDMCSNLKIDIEETFSNMTGEEI